MLGLVDGEVPPPAGALDAVTAFDVLEHVPDDARMVRGFYRLLKSQLHKRAGVSGRVACARVRFPFGVSLLMVARRQ